MIPNLLTLFMDIDPTVWVLAPIALMVEAKENFATVLTKCGPMVGVLLKVVWDACVQLGAFRLFTFPPFFFRQPMYACMMILQNMFLDWWFLKHSDSHAFWAVVYDLVVAPLVKGHLAALAGKALTIGIHWMWQKRQKTCFPNPQIKFSSIAQNTGWRNAWKSSKIFVCLWSNPTVGLNMCPLTGKTFSTFFPLLLTSSSPASTQGETSRMRLPDGFIGCLNWPDLRFRDTFCCLCADKTFDILASCIQVGARDLTSWSWSLVPQFLIHLQEFKSYLEIRNSMNLAGSEPVGLERVPGWTFHSTKLLSSCSFLSSPWIPHLPCGWERGNLALSCFYLQPDKANKGGAWFPFCEGEIETLLLENWTHQESRCPQQPRYSHCISPPPSPSLYLYLMYFYSYTLQRAHHHGQTYPSANMKSQIIPVEVCASLWLTSCETTWTIVKVNPTPNFRVSSW